MARIRSIKPELRTSLTVASWPREVRYAWVLLWGYLDDYGRGVDDIRLLVADLFPLDRDVTERKLNSWLGRMTEKLDDDKTPPLCRYEVKGRKYMHATNWREHQKPAHPTTSRIPPCPIHEEIANDSGDDPEHLASDSRNVPEQFSPSRAPAEQGAGSREMEQGAGSSRRGTRLANDWTPNRELVDQMRAEDIPDDIARTELAKFRDYWAAKPGQAGVKLDWNATWRNWLRTAVERRGRPPNGTQQHTDDLFERAAQRMGVTP